MSQSKKAPNDPKVGSGENAQVPRPSNFGITVLRVLALLAVIGITVFIYSIRDRVSQFATFGYQGIFLVALLANATVLIPAPGIAIVYAMGSIFNPLGVGLAAASGGALGELSGYLAGFSGQAVVERSDIYSKIHPDRKSTRLNSSHIQKSRMPSSA